MQDGGVEVAARRDAVHHERMPKSDRAFRALARELPDVVAELLRAVAPSLVPVGAVLVPDDLAPTHLDALPPELDADWAARVASDLLIHTECQGYRDHAFGERVLWYHIGFALRHRGKRRVSTVALWLIEPPDVAPKDTVTVGDITVKVTTVVLPKVQASVLLAHPATACFAAGADAEGRSNEALCADVAAALKLRQATWPERHMAVVAAAMRGRYDAMVTAMEQANMEPVVIEDLVKFGEDRGEVRRARADLRRVFARRRLVVGAEDEARIDACADLDTLDHWLDEAIVATNAAEVFH
jgi:hypothetical protein